MSDESGDTQVTAVEPVDQTEEPPLPPGAALPAAELLRGGLSLRVLLREHKVRHGALAKRAYVSRPIVTRVLAGPESAKRVGPGPSLRVYQAAARALGVRLAEVPEAAWAIRAAREVAKQKKKE